MSENNLKVVEINDREQLQQKQRELDALDMTAAQLAFNTFIKSEEWTKHGCLLLPQGQFIGNEIKVSLVIVKAK